MKIWTIAAAAVLAGGCCATIENAAPAAASETRYADEFNLSGATCGLGKTLKAGKSVDGGPLSVNGKVYAHGFGTRPESGVMFRLDGTAKAFEAKVAMDDSSAQARNKNSWGVPAAIFRVWTDGRIAWESKGVQSGVEPKEVRVDLEGVREVVLETTGGAPWTSYDAANADWLEACFVCREDTEIEAVNDPTLVEQLGVLTPPEKREPQINGADIWGVRPGRPVIFRVATSGARPMMFTAEGLPAGVVLDDKGVMRGTAPAAPGNYDVKVVAENAFGKAEKTIRLAVGDTIALTPPMGWNSWNTQNFRLTADGAAGAALALEKSGLGNHGWAYVNLDDWWQMNTSAVERIELRKEYFGGREDVMGPGRDENGKIIPNRAFPDMKGLADYIHSFGFKAGLYSSPGPLTCGRCEGSYGHELQDAGSWAEWGFDYVKYDLCTYRELIKEEIGEFPYKGDRTAFHESYIKPYSLMNECLKKQNRDIVYSYCQYGIGQAQDWVRRNGGNCWRSWGDLKDSWHWMELEFEGFINAEYWKYSGPGCWADPDMMIVGWQFSFGSDHPTFLTPNEQYTHVSLWAMAGSPLMIGCDLNKLDAFTYGLLANDEVIAVSQDRLGKVARRIRHTDAESVYTRPLSNGFTAVALVNRYPFAREIAVDFSDLGFDGECFVKDLWRQKCEGRHSGTYVAKVPPHGTKLVKMRPVDCQKCE